MEDRELVVGGFYKHFKDKLYQVKCIAYHSETKEKMVVYQALYGDYAVYVRPYDMFMSRVDRVKYPDVLQEYRFEQVTPGGSDATKSLSQCDIDVTKSQPQCGSDASKSQPQDKSMLMRFLDAETYQEKLDILKLMKDTVTDDVIDTMAVSMDVAVKDGDIASRYQSLMNCVRMQTKYECNRLR